MWSQHSPFLVVLTTIMSTLTCCTALRSTTHLLRSETQQDRRLEEGHLPTFESEWEKLDGLEFPEDVGESQGALIGTDLYSVGGFLKGFDDGLKQGFALDLSDPSATWRELAPHPIDPFLTHAAQAVVGDNLFYTCGGYLGGHPGPATDECYVFDKTDGPMGSWTQLPSLPERRGGGGMVYIENKNALLFALGADRPDGTAESTIDLDGTWMLKLNNLEAGWKRRKTIPYKSNHVSTVVAKDCSGKTRYYFLGGQIGENENDSNLSDMYEYLPGKDEWVQRASMLEGRGHFTTSTVPYGCGFVIVAGAVDGKDRSRFIKTNDISYYDASLDKWTSIGFFPRKQKTPVCAIYDDWLYCTCGYEVDTFRAKLSFPKLVTTESPSATMEVAKLTIKVKKASNCRNRRVIVKPKDSWKNRMEGVEVKLDIAAPAGPLMLTATSNARGRARFRDIQVNHTAGESVITACVSNGHNGTFCEESILPFCR